MKNVLTGLILTLASSKLLALPLGNPSDSALLTNGVVWESSDFCCLGLRLGFYGDYVFNRYLKDNALGFHKHVEEANLFTNAAYIGFSLWDRFEAFSTIGGSSLKLYSNFAAFGPGPGFTHLTGQQIEIETQTSFSWSAGLRGILWECGSFCLGAEGQYFRTSPEIAFILLEDEVSNYPENLLLKYHEWQVGLGISYLLNSYISPYLAIKGSWASVDMGNSVITFTGRSLTETATLLDLKNSRYFGYAIGVSFIFCEGISCTVEGRFVDEKALYVNGQVRF